MSLIEILAGKGATPEAVEASIRQTIQEEVAASLAALKSDLATGEQTALDAGKADMQLGITQLGTLFAGLMETHTLKIDPRAGGVDVTWEKKA